MTALVVREHVALAPLTTLGVGGAARWFVAASDEATVLAARAWARARGVPLRVLGGGSNLLVADAGVDGLVVQVALRGIRVRETPEAVEVTAAAGEPWDDLVRRAVARGLGRPRVPERHPRAASAPRRSRTSAPTGRK